MRRGVDAGPTSTALPTTTRGRCSDEPATGVAHHGGTKHDGRGNDDSCAIRSCCRLHRGLVDIEVVHFSPPDDELGQPSDRRDV
jgi:hypothetical protein